MRNLARAEAGNMLARDWLKTLWPASFKGVPFQVESDAEKGGRRKAVHQYPGRDDPFIEDLGEDKREFSVTAYVASDAADADAAALIEICAGPKAGTLVLPSHGPIEVQCLTFKRNRKSDKHGYIAIELEFVRDGSNEAQPSILSLANLVFVDADVLQSAIAGFCIDSVVALGQADYVILAGVEAMRDVAALFESIRTTAPVDTAVSAVQRSAIQALHDDAPSLIHRLTGVDPALGLRIATIARALGDGIAAPAARAAFLPLIDMLPDVPVDPAGTASANQAAGNVNAVRRAARLAVLTVAAESVARDDAISDRSAGITLRADLTELFDAEISGLDMSHGDMIDAVQGLRGAAVDYLSQKITTLAPVISANSNLTMPSLAWAWRLYADPSRADELVARNNVAHPSFMPVEIEALAS
jgi:prophage DNA circulation protein